MTEVAGIVLDLHGHGALVRLADGRLAALPPNECTVGGEVLRAAARDRSALRFTVDDTGRRPVLRLAVNADRATPSPSAEAPAFPDAAFEEKMTGYLRSLEDGFAPAGEPDAAERERRRKARRARGFEAPPGLA